MATQLSQEAKKRRERILARAAKEERQNEERTTSGEGGPDVFQKYRLIKEKEKYEQVLGQASKVSGFVMIALTYFGLSPFYVFGITFLLALLGSLIISKNITNTKEQLSWITQNAPKAALLTNNIDSLLRLFFCFQILLKMVCSYIVAATLFNILLVSLMNLTGQTSTPTEPYLNIPQL